MTIVRAIGVVAGSNVVGVLVSISVKALVSLSLLPNFVSLALAYFTLGVLGVLVIELICFLGVCFAITQGHIGLDTWRSVLQLSISFLVVEDAILGGLVALAVYLK